MAVLLLDAAVVETEGRAVLALARGEATRLEALEASYRAACAGLRRALSSGRVGGGVGALETSSTDVVALNRAIEVGDACELQDPHLRRLVSSALGVRELRLRALHDLWRAPPAESLCDVDCVVEARDEVRLCCAHLAYVAAMRRGLAIGGPLGSTVAGTFSGRSCRSDDVAQAARQCPAATLILALRRAARRDAWGTTAKRIGRTTIVAGVVFFRDYGAEPGTIAAALDGEIDSRFLGFDEIVSFRTELYDRDARRYLREAVDELPQWSDDGLDRWEPRSSAGLREAITIADALGCVSPGTRGLRLAVSRLVAVVDAVDVDALAAAVARGATEVPDVDLRPCERFLARRDLILAFCDADWSALRELGELCDRAVGLAAAASPGLSVLVLAATATRRLGGPLPPRSPVVSRRRRRLLAQVDAAIAALPATSGNDEDDGLAARVAAVARTARAKLDRRLLLPEGAASVAVVVAGTTSEDG